MHWTFKATCSSKKADQGSNIDLPFRFLFSLINRITPLFSKWGIKRLTTPLFRLLRFFFFLFPTNHQVFSDHSHNSLMRLSQNSLPFRFGFFWCFRLFGSFWFFGFTGSPFLLTDNFILVIEVLLIRILKSRTLIHDT